MLEERWRETVQRRGPALALCDLGSGQSLTFSQLADAADAEPSDRGPVVFPSGRDAGFILNVLRAWKSGRVLCPLEPGQPPPALPPPPPGVAHLKLTSGVSGAPKCVLFTEAQLAADAHAIVTAMGLHEDSPNLGAISLAHSYGYSNLVLPLLLHGIPLVLAPSALPAALVRTVRHLGDTPVTLAAVPALWAAWDEADALPRRLHRAISAGAPLPLALEERVFERRGLKIHNFLGASECGGITYDASNTPRSRNSQAGGPLPGVHLSVSADGCLEVRSPAVGLGYWPEPDPRLAQGVYRSQDLATVDADGSLHLLGRAGDVINVAGRKVPPETVEQALLRHPAVRAVLVLGVPARDWHGDHIAAVVELRGPATPSELRRHLARSLPDWQLPRRWHFVDELRTSDRGKLSRSEWRRVLAQQETHPPPPPGHDAQPNAS